ncbi:alpha/beta hydrolase [Actinocorallia sp. A-T 12471]|uniref:alpha/beta hydrolase n=1 Tax=Actinocorallia sp. A-T 12471 TaxID=3089813 RepID=UPI0029D220F9|nr:alpha/beta hydrolase [Actinocorallia sp. A-T 12471]MDX6738426.1 alpha/beta hydrolase [Actinocorallia sp. A-T 12471]
MRRPALFVAAVSFASALSLGGGAVYAAPVPVPSSTTDATDATGPTDVSDAVARLAVKKIVWQKCFDASAPARYRRLQCAEVKVPRDWAKPDGAKITIAVSRLKARGKPKGVLFTNPGGPGASGLLTPLLFVDAQRKRLMDTQDIIGFDVRGTGYSTQHLCKELPEPPMDSRDRSTANTKRLLNFGAAVSKACRTGGGLASKYVTTAQTVRDIEFLRRSLKTSKGAAVTKINWLGYSAGTWLGAHYAAAYPKRTGRFVLDSVVNFAATWQQHNYLQPVGFQRRFAQDFARWAAKYDYEYALGGTAKAVVARYEAIRKEIGAQGGVDVETVDGYAFTLFPDDLDNLVAFSLYTRYQFPPLAQDLKTLSAVLADPARRKPLRLQSADDPYSAEIATFYGIQCNDTKFTGTPAQHAAKTAQIGAKHPLIGYSVITDPCAAWTRTTGPKLKRPGKGLPRTLLVQSRNDPATPYEGAAKTRQKFKNSRLVTVKNEGDHGIYASGNACVDKIVDAYLIDGVFPKKDRTCAGLPIPDADGLRPGLPATNPLLHLKDLTESLTR